MHPTLSLARWPTARPLSRPPCWDLPGGAAGAPAVVETGSPWPPVVPPPRPLLVEGSLLAGTGAHPHRRLPTRHHAGGCPRPPRGPAGTPHQPPWTPHPRHSHRPGNLARKMQRVATAVRRSMGLWVPKRATRCATKGRGATRAAARGRPLPATRTGPHRPRRPSTAAAAMSRPRRGTLTCSSPGK